MKYFIKMLETIDNKQKTYLNSESASVLRYVFFYCKYCGRGFYGGDGGSRTPVRKHRPLNFLQA